MKKIAILGFCLAFGFQVNAKELVSRDSVGIEKVGNKTFIIHQVEEKETLFGISRRYQVAVNDVIESNPLLSEGIKIGQRIRIPFITKSAIPSGSTLHKVIPGETMFSISKKYGVSVNDILSWNSLQGADLSVGQSLVIKGVEQKPAPIQAETLPAALPKEQKTTPAVTTTPAPAKTIAEAKPEVKKEPTTATTNSTAPVKTNVNTNLPGDWITHTVVQGETLFSISQKYNANVKDIQSWNGLGSNSISIGQKLKVGREANSNVPVVTSSVPVIINNEKTNATLNTTKSSESNSEASTAYKNIKETGLAEVIEGTANHKKYLVLHKEAPVGTIMRVRNEENDITIFARVVGKLPDTGDNSKLVVKLSKAAYDQLRAVNPRFPVEVSY
ncbi:LysM peptidoglycan-binding domain-containing protein [Aquiflexum gelatinilyticum]|uniref:LysM peptidoglycan-binding domain-containing protein n=1 Tax=Aquiflexum gelatinilyticum TaxID=2961943 RepID=UPI002168B565|nr:LysM peptidoglycan-binding domain-containing protein [Aquiflexum gelatinilyticum]MCS4433248.1 LysM peptidoglycan-binding domain-containing protein [Aquiflexum gelatinilyticum]